MSIGQNIAWLQTAQTDGGGMSKVFSIVDMGSFSGEVEK
jgi:hypothetical protein